MTTSSLVIALFTITAIGALLFAVWQARRAKQARENNEPASLEARRKERQSEQQA